VPGAEKMNKLKVIGIVLVDQGIKQLMISRGVFQLNPGIAFGWGNQWQWLWLFFNLGLLVWLMLKFKLNFPLGLIISGGMGNWLDRVFRGGVVDYIFLPFLPVFNLSDALIVAGGVSLMYSLVYGSKSNFRR